MKWEIRLALGLLMILILLSLQACGQVPFVEKIEKQQQSEAVVEQHTNNHTPHFQGIANALGCVFAPNTCEKSK